MRHLAAGLLGFALLLPSYAAADEAADRAAIDRVIAALNQSQQRTALFTENATIELAKLPKVNAKQFRVIGVSLRPTVTISHEPWGEATINWPGIPLIPALEITNPRIAGGVIQFLTPDIALVEGNWIYQDSSAAQRIPLLFVMKKESDGWKIASLRVLAPR